tara:strand:+ start:138 stop:521 length:384 start_codon:yes stop_codon:yes gene_type:complete
MRLRKEEREALGYNKPERKIVVRTVKQATIEKGIPMPPWGRPTAYNYPYEEMEIGDSFKVMHTEASNEKVSNRVHTWMRGASNTKQLRFACRKGVDPDGQTFTRVWRTEPDPDIAMMDAIQGEDIQK